MKLLSRVRVLGGDDDIVATAEPTLVKCEG
jgi:hypothetical protein